METKGKKAPCGGAQTQIAASGLDLVASSVLLKLVVVPLYGVFGSEALRTSHQGHRSPLVLQLPAPLSSTTTLAAASLCYPDHGTATG